MYLLRCMHYVFDACNTKFTVSYGQILVWFGIDYIPQGTIELILRDDFVPVRYVDKDQVSFGACATLFDGHLCSVMNLAACVYT